MCQRVMRYCSKGWPSHPSLFRGLAEPPFLVQRAGRATLPCSEGWPSHPSLFRGLAEPPFLVQRAGRATPPCSEGWPSHPSLFRGLAEPPFLVQRAGRATLPCSEGWPSHPSLFRGLAEPPFLVQRAGRATLPCSEGWPSHPSLFRGLAEPPFLVQRAGRATLPCSEGWPSHPFLFRGLAEPPFLVQRAGRATLPCSEGWPSHPSLPMALRPHWQCQHELTIQNGILLKGICFLRLVIPGSMRLDMLDRLHEGHQGVVKSRARAPTSVWWPGLGRQLEEILKNCTTCAMVRQNPAEPMIASDCHLRPWQHKAGTDLFFFKKATYLLVVDNCSSYVEIALRFALPQ